MYMYSGNLCLVFEIVARSWVKLQDLLKNFEHVEMEQASRTSHSNNNLFVSE